MSNTFVLDSNYLARKRKEIKNEISYARYQVGGNWYQAKIETATVLTVWSITNVASTRPSESTVAVSIFA